MITIIFAPPRTGKTCFLTHIARERAFDRERNKCMQREILQKRANGFTELAIIPMHSVSTNYTMVLQKYGYSNRYNRTINPYQLGFANEFVQTHFNLPFETICITEAQNYLNSRMSIYFPAWQSRWYEQHGHNNLDIFLDTQRPMLIDVNIRELASFVEIVKLYRQYDRKGKIKALTWQIRKIENSSLFSSIWQVERKICLVFKKNM